MVPASFIEIVSDADISKDAVLAFVKRNFVSRNELELDLTAGSLGIYDDPIKLVSSPDTPHEIMSRVNHEVDI